MSTELSIIKLLLKREFFSKYSSIIFKIKTQPETQRILNAVDRYYKEFPDHNYIAQDELVSFYFLEYPSDKNNQEFKEMFDRIATLEVSDSVATKILHKHIENHYGSIILHKLLPALSDEAFGVLQEVPEIIEQYKEAVDSLDAEDDDMFVTDDLVDLSSELDKSTGLKWRLNCLNRNIGGMSGSTLGHIFARVECGKTTLVSSEVANFARQMVDTDREILWIANEEDGRRVKLRTWESVLAMSGPEIAAHVQAGKVDVLRDQYARLGGNKIHVRYDPTTSYEDILMLMEQMNVGILVVDIADHVRYRGDRDATNGAARLGDLYRRYRSLAYRFDTDVLTVGQASADVGGKKILHEEDMHNSKTDKPGALDYAFGIGKTYSEEDEATRWINIVKNKIGETLDDISVVQIDKQRGLFTDFME